MKKERKSTLELEQTLKSGYSIDFYPSQGRIELIEIVDEQERTKMVRINEISQMFNRRFRLSWNGRKFQAKLINDPKLAFRNDSVVNVLEAIRSFN